jgi:hypothetical protein
LNVLAAAGTAATTAAPSASASKEIFRMEFW